MQDGVKVLVLDDEDMVRDNLEAYLEDEGFEVVACGSGEEAVAMLDTVLDVEACIVDMRLPGMSGNDFIEKAYAKKNTLKFIIHTGSTNYRLPLSLIKIGLTEHSVFNKPVADMGALVDALRNELS